MRGSSRDLSSFLRRNRRLLFVPFLVIFSFLFFSTLRDGLNYNEIKTSQQKGGSLQQSTNHNINDPASRYRHQQNRYKYNEKSSQYEIAIIADMDTSSKRGKEWSSFLKKGTLTRNEKTGHYSITWKSEVQLSSALNEAGRAMELSELVYFEERLLTFDDRTGIVFEVLSNEAIPLHILMNGDGKTNKGFKTEWATVKDDLLYVGSTGKEWTAGEVVINKHPMWVKTINTEGKVSHVDWTDVYERLRIATGTSYPGYMLHEAVNFNPMDKRWYFLPRRVSSEPYNDVEDERRGSNLLLSMDVNMKDLKISQLGPLNHTHGFSSFKFLPWRENELVALKTEENGARIATYILVLDLDGRVLMEVTEIGDIKYEGVEFI